MALKFIFIASFGLTGLLFYVSKQSQAEFKSLAVESTEPSPKSPRPTLRQASPKTTPSRPLAAADYLNYAALLPTRGQGQASSIQNHAPRDDFYAKYVYPTVRACFNKLIERRKMIYKERDGDAELSFHGELEIKATFEQRQVASLRSRSSEVRDDTFHNCIEANAKDWIFPESISSQGQWRYKQGISFDVNYHYKCKDPSLRLSGSTEGPVVASGTCL